MALPHYAQIAFERLWCDATLRTEPMLDLLLSDYARICGAEVAPEDRQRTLDLCRQRFPDFKPS